MDFVQAEAAGDTEVLDIGAGESRGFLPPCVWRNVEIFGAHQVADAAAFVDFGDASPEAIELLLELIGLVEENRGSRDEIENGVVSSGNGSIKLPAGEDIESPGADRGFDNFFRPGNALATEPRMNCAEKVLADWSFGERKQERFIDGIGRTLGGGIELANGIGLVAEEFDAQGAIGFGRVHVEDAAAQGVLAGHLDYVSGGIADGVEVREKSVEIEGFAATNGPGEIGIVVAGTKADCGGRDGRDHDRGCAGGDLPQRGGAFFLEFRMRR